MAFEILGDVEGFLSEIFSSLASRGIDVSRFELDHICYRVETLEEYAEMNGKLSALGICLGEHQIGGRPIATYKMREPIVFREREIFCVELPSPKSSSPHPRGLEHAEFVIDESFESFMAKYPEVNFETKGMMKKHNPELELEFGRLAVKFHSMALERVIQNETETEKKAGK